MGSETPDDLGEFDDPSPVAIVMGIIHTSSEHVQDHSVGPLNLTIAPRVRDGGVICIDEVVGIEILEVRRGEMGAEVGDDAIRGAESVDDLLQKLGCNL